MQALLELQCIAGLLLAAAMHNSRGLQTCKENPEINPKYAYLRHDLHQAGGEHGDSS